MSFATPSGGKVLQVISTFKADTFTTTSGSFVDITGLSVSITPSSATSKILIISSFIVSNGSGGFQTFINLVRGATNIAQSTGMSNNATVTTIQGGDNLNGVAISFLDSPSTTSATTYKLQMKTAGGTTGAIGRRGGTTDDGASSTITVMEIAG